ncbi:hypothetical protein HDU67_007564 [Dinochytrium kinnereticum]|nr:hypothetical protein HDU67_007564 [Dinochytrium kinnereticum]
MNRRLYLFTDGSALGLFGPIKGEKRPDIPFDRGASEDCYLACHLSPSASILVVETIADPSPQTSSALEAVRLDESRVPERYASTIRDIKAMHEGMLKGSGRIKRERFLTSQAPERYWGFVEFLLAFRNTYGGGIGNPYIPCRSISMDDRKKAMTMSSPAESARWPIPKRPLSAEQTFQSLKEFIHHDDDLRRTIVSIDQSVKLRLERNGQTFSVQYPVAIEDVDELVEQAKIKLARSAGDSRGRRKGPFVYIWIEQIFSVYDPPSCWKYPLELVLGRIGEEELMDLATTTGYLVASSYVVTPLPQANLKNSPSDSSNAQFDPNVDEILHPLTPKPLKMFWNNRAMFRIIPIIDETTKHHDFDVEAVLHCDGTVVRSSDGFEFITVTTANHDLLQDGDMYPASESPDNVSNFTTGQKYNLTDLKTTMLKLYHNACHTLAERPTHLEPPEEKDPAPSSPSSISNQTFEISGVGVFDVFYDHNVRATFEDGAVVEVTKARELVPFCLCSRGMHVVWGVDKVVDVIGADGERLLLRMSRPIGYEE